MCVFVYVRACDGVKGFHLRRQSRRYINEEVVKFEDFFPNRTHAR